MSSAADAANFKRIFSGKWKFDRTENLDAFLKAQDSNPEFQEMEKKSKPLLTISVDDDTTINFKSQEPEYTFTMSCKLGEISEFKDDPNNPTMHTKQKAWMEGDEMHETNESVFPSGGKPYTTMMSVINGEMVVVTKIGDIAATRFYKNV